MAFLVEKQQDNQSEASGASFKKVNNDDTVIKFIAFVQLDSFGGSDVQALKKIPGQPIPSGAVDNPRNGDVHVLRNGLIKNPKNLCIRYLVNEERIEFMIIDETSNSIKKLMIKEIGIVILSKNFLIISLIVSMYVSLTT